MVTPVDEPQEEEQDDIIVPEVVEVSAPATSNKITSKFDFSVDDTGNSNLTVYTISIGPVSKESVALTILAPSYATALEMAGISKDMAVKVSVVPFEG